MCFNYTNNKILISKDVYFDEDEIEISIVDNSYLVDILKKFLDFQTYVSFTSYPLSITTFAPQLPMISSFILPIDNLCQLNSHIPMQEPTN